MKNLDHYLEKAISNVENDREVTKELLDDVIRFLGKSEENHRQVGMVAAKYVETLQRSNEQLVKISTIIHKQQSGDQGLTDADKKDIFNLLQDDSVGEKSDDGR